MPVTILFNVSVGNIEIYQKKPSKYLTKLIRCIFILNVIQGGTLKIPCARTDAVHGCHQTIPSTLGSDGFVFMGSVTLDVQKITRTNRET